MNGFVIVNKPVGLSSHQVVSRARKILNTRKIGHNGTLDPFASGLLILSVGEYTKYIPYLPQSPKQYTATLKLGEYTDTWDNEGVISQYMPIPSLNQNQILQALSKVQSMTSQQIPAFSAKRHDGKRLYDYARNNEEAPTFYKPVQINALELISFDETCIQFRTCVSSGTFIRTMGQDIAKALNTCGHLTHLQRTAVGHIHLSHSQNLESPLIFSSTPLDHIPCLTLDDKAIEKLCHGQSVTHHDIAPDLYRLFNQAQVFLGLVEIDNQYIRVKRMNNTQNIL